MKLGAACGYHAAPILCAAKKENPPLLGGLNEMKLGRHDKYHATLLLSIRIPPLLGGIIQLKQGGVWISRHLAFAIAGKNPPQMMRGIKKLERSGVWDAHCSFTSGRPNEAVCGMHTASFASPLTPFSALLAPSVFMTWRSTAGTFAV